MSKIIATLGGVSLLIPLVVFGQGAVKDTSSLFELLLKILDQLTVVIVAAAVVVFLYGVLRYMISEGDEEKRTHGKKLAMYGIVAIFVMISVWGLVNILSGTFGFTNTTAPTVPKLIPGNR